MFGYKIYLQLGELPDSSITGLYKNSYELLSCKYSLGQGTDQNAKVQTDVIGGSINFSYANTPPSELVQWMLQPSKLQNGSIVICDTNGKLIKKIYFEDATCSGMDIKQNNNDNATYLTKVKIQVRKFILDSAVPKDRWINLRN